MKVWGVTEEQIRESADEVGLKMYGEWPGESWGGRGIEKDGRALRFRLGVNTEQARNAEGFLPYQRKSMSLSSAIKGRRIAAVCWHGHRDFMRALFRRAPEARIKSALADYRGVHDFESTFESTFGEGTNYHLSYGQACGCDESHRVTFSTVSPGGYVSDVRMIRQSDILACPFTIIVADHYRADGSCKCDDPEHRAMMIAEWEYEPSDFDGVPLRVTA